MVDAIYEKGKNPDAIPDIVTFGGADHNLTIHIDMLRLPKGDDFLNYSAFTEVYLPYDTSYTVQELTEGIASQTV